MSDAATRDILPARPPVLERLGRVGVWTDVFDRTPAHGIPALARAVEGAQVPTMWIPEVRGGRDGMTLAGHLLCATEQLVVGNGIVRVADRTPGGLASATQLLADAHPGRHVLGVGLGAVAPAGEAPVRVMETYLRDMDRHRAALAVPVAHPQARVVAAYGPAMTRLAGTAAHGAHTYLVPVEHTVRTRELLGPAPLLAVEQTVLVDSDPARARAGARAFLAVYLTIGFNRAKFARLGYSEAELDDGGSDRLIDDLVAHGDIDSIRARVEAQLAAGADHVAVQFLGARTPSEFLTELTTWAPALIG